MAIVKSKLLKQLSDNYPNFLKKDLEKSLNIVLNEIKLALYNGDNVELRESNKYIKTTKIYELINPTVSSSSIRYSSNVHETECYH